MAAVAGYGDTWVTHRVSHGVARTTCALPASKGFPTPSVAHAADEASHPAREECVICLDVINDDKTVDSVVTGRMQFTCMHNVCRRCFEETKLESCPVCRCKGSLQAVINKVHGRTHKGKGKGKGKGKRGDRPGR